MPKFQQLQVTNGYARLTIIPSLNRTFKLFFRLCYMFLAAPLYSPFTVQDVAVEKVEDMARGRSIPSQSGQSGALSYDVWK